MFSTFGVHMKIVLSLLAFAGFAVAGQASAGCEVENRVTGSEFSTLLGQGALICGRRATGSPATDRWQEEHRSGNELWDYKKGSSDSIDPTKKVGRWELGVDTVTHDYGSPALTWVWSVHRIVGSPGVYSFCTADRAGVEIVRAYITTGSGPCASYPP